LYRIATLALFIVGAITFKLMDFFAPTPP